MLACSGPRPSAACAFRARVTGRAGRALMAGGPSTAAAASAAIPRQLTLRWSLPYRAAGEAEDVVFLADLDRFTGAEGGKDGVRSKARAAVLTAVAVGRMRGHGTAAAAAAAHYSRTSGAGGAATIMAGRALARVASGVGLQELSARISPEMPAGADVQVPTIDLIEFHRLIVGWA